MKSMKVCLIETFNFQSSSWTNFITEAKISRPFAFPFKLVTSRRIAPREKEIAKLKIRETSWQ